MKSINSLDITRLRVEEDFGFQKRIESETALLTEETDKPMVDAFKAAVAAFDAALKASTRNSQSSAVIHADEQADAAWSGLNAQTKVMLSHPNPELRLVACEAYPLIQKYGNITGMAYNEEYGRMHNLLQDLATLGVAKQKQIYIDAWVTELQLRYDEFMAADAARTAEESTRIVGMVKQARMNADTAFRTLVERVNALALVNGEAPYATFIDHVNVVIRQANAVLTARRTRGEKDGKDDRPVIE